MPGEDDKREGFTDNDIRAALNLGEDKPLTVHRASPPNVEPEPDPQPDPNPEPEPVPEPDPQPDPEPDPDTLPEVNEIPEDVEIKEAPEPEPEEIELPEDASENTRQAMISMRKRVDQAKKDAKEAQDQLKASEDQMAELQKELDQRQSEISAIDLSRDPEFAERYNKPIDEKWQQAVQIMNDLRKDPSILTKAARMTTGKRLEFLNDQVPEASPTINVILMDIASMQKTRSEALKKHSETRAKIDHDRQQRDRQRIGTAFDTATDALLEQGHFLLKASENTTWSKSRQARIDRAKSFLGETDPQSQAEIALRAAMADEILAWYQAERDARIRAEEKAGIKRKVRPAVKASNKVPQPKKDNSKAISPTDAAAAIAANLGKKTS